MFLMFGYQNHCVYCDAYLSMVNKNGRSSKIGFIELLHIGIPVKVDFCYKISNICKTTQKSFLRITLITGVNFNAPFKPLHVQRYRVRISEINVRLPRGILPYTKVLYRSSRFRVHMVLTLDVNRNKRIFIM